MEKKKERRRLIGWLILLAILMLGLLGGIYARYVTRRMERAEMLSSSFHFSSNYLEEEPAPHYAVSDMSEISFEIYNYEKTNLDSISGEEILYRIKTDSVWGVEVKDSAGKKISPEKGSSDLFRLPKSQNREVYTVRIHGGDKDRPVTVTAETVSPYSLELKATFSAEAKPASYKLEDCGNYCLLTVYSNDHSGPFTVTWDPRKVSPDNLNPLMTQWQDTKPNEVFHTEKDTVYELIFVKNQETPVSPKDEIGASAAIE